MASRRKPRLAVFKLASCDGCQLSILDCEEELLDLARAVEIAHFLEASRAVRKPPYDVALVEGSITTPADAERIQQIRRGAKVLVAIGACATSGGIQALRNFRDTRALAAAVYATPEYVSTLDTSTSIAEHVKVDYELRGCPVGKTQLLELLAALLHGRKPVLPTHSVCLECKERGVPCLMVARGVPCLGPVTQAGCGVLCPSFDRGCFGCFGPAESPNVASLGRLWAALGVSPDGVLRAFRSFTAGAPGFRAAGESHDRRA